jgi:hypothetical protein
MAWKRHDVRSATRRVNRIERQRVRTVVRRDRAAAWSRRRAWAAAVAGQVARLVTTAAMAAIAAAAAGIERAEQAWIRYEAQRAAKRAAAQRHAGDTGRVTVGEGSDA